MAPPRSPRHEIIPRSTRARSELRSHALPKSAQPAPLACCFPYPVTYAVRGGSQWIVNGSFSSFEHHLIPDPNATDSSTAACIESCDPNLELLNGRAPRRSITPATRHATDATSRAGLLGHLGVQKPVHSVRGLGSGGVQVRAEAEVLAEGHGVHLSGGRRLHRRCWRHSPPTLSSFRKGSPSFPASRSWPSPTRPRKG